MHGKCAPGNRRAQIKAILSSHLPRNSAGHLRTQDEWARVSCLNPTGGQI